ncbi:MAG: hypothetical protein KA739_13385 [Pseudomonadales bacterium]|jgi:transcriptional regulator with XRE-family HTH domain|nr:XRE family transcriptional regulator [Gammaproteobacteria bacterium]MBK8307799.1 XRE family transcriptional regulator [Gammaproteobacteria bacterium]MBK9668028.1 XRE family transcriptional regulator [Gammaproteobacteria bacterium]MBP6052832.1 hypothetical protein [Pseudomonadales bacterium]MBP6229754.1 hypothetical protein [Pseudomonadales bacterium]
MTERKKRKTSPTSKGRSNPKRPDRASDEAPSTPRGHDSPLSSFIDSISGITTDLTSTALKIASRTRETAARAVARTPEQLRMMAAAGESLRDMREVAGMTVIEVSDALNLRDKSILEAVEDGREVLSFELILRLASLVARNDPLPFVLRYTRTYHPRLWQVLHDLKIDQLPIQFERERNFINIYRRHDTARKLSDAGFQRVLQFTQDAFDMAIHFVAEQERIGEPPTEQDEEPKPGARRVKRRS